MSHSLGSAEPDRLWGGTRTAGRRREIQVPCLCFKSPFSMGYQYPFTTVRISSSGTASRAGFGCEASQLSSTVRNRSGITWGAWLLVSMQTYEITISAIRSPSRVNSNSIESERLVIEPTVTLMSTSSS